MIFRSLFYSTCLLLLVPLGPILAEDFDSYATLQADGIKSEVKVAPDRVISVGDIHGDLRALLSILLDRKLIDQKGVWAGGRAHLVLMGDLVSGQRESRLVVQFLMRLEKEALLRGGRVHSLIGNRDVQSMTERGNEMESAERALYELFPQRGTPGPEAFQSFRGNTEVAVWLRKRNSMVKMGSDLYVHAGLLQWANDHSRDKVNSTIRNWIRYLQGHGRKPPENTRWTIGIPVGSDDEMIRTGPLFTKAFKAKWDDEGAFEDGRPKEGVSKEELVQIFKSYKISRMILGHAPVATSRILLSHPYYGDKVVLLDTRIQDPDEGRVSSLEVAKGKSSVKYHRRSSKAARLIKAELIALTGDCHSSLDSLGE